MRRLLSAHLDAGIQAALFIACMSKDTEESSQGGDSEGRKHLGEAALAFNSLIRFGESHLPKRSFNSRSFEPLSHEKGTNDPKAE